MNGILDLFKSILFEMPSDPLIGLRLLPLFSRVELSHGLIDGLSEVAYESSILILPGPILKGAAVDLPEALEPRGRRFLSVEGILTAILEPVEQLLQGLDILFQAQYSLRGMGEV